MSEYQNPRKGTETKKTPPCTAFTIWDQSTKIPVRGLKPYSTVRNEVLNSDAEYQNPQS